MPTLPLWSAIMLGDLGRHGSSASYERHKLTPGIKSPSKTTSVQEGRFNQLKTVILQGKSRNRVDVFSEKLRETTKAAQTLALRERRRQRELGERRHI